MDTISDYFISYNNDIPIKQEKLSDPDISLNSSYSFPNDSHLQHQLFLSPLMENVPQNDLKMKETIPMNFEFPIKSKKPFKIIRMKREASNDSIDVKVEPEKKVMDNFRREIKRQATKRRIQMRANPNSEMGSDDQTSMLEGLSKSDMDEKSQKKMLQMIRNRISAQNSRDKRKNYVGALENVQDTLYLENEKLNQEKLQLINEMKKIELTNNELLKERNSLLKGESVGCFNCQPLFGDIQESNTLQKENQLAIGHPTRENSIINLGISLGVVFGSIMANELKKQNELNIRVENTNQGTQIMDLRGLSIPMMRETHLFVDQEDGILGVLRKCSKSTIASPTHSPIHEESLRLNRHGISQPGKPSFWESVSLNMS